MDPERRLRARVEELVAATAAPSLELYAQYQAVGDAVRFGAIAGLVATSRARKILQDTDDALAVRGIEWLELAAPDLPDVVDLHVAGSAPARGELQRVVPVGALLETHDGQRSTIASLDVYADRTVVRTTRGDAAPSSWEFSPSPDAADPTLLIEISPGRSAGVDLTRFAAASDVSARMRSIGAGELIERYGWQQLALVARENTVESMSNAARRIRAAAELLDLPDAAARFDATLARVAAAPPAAAADQAARDAAPLSVVPVAARVRLDGTRTVTFLSIERWRSSWRLVVEGVSMTSWRVWTAVDDAGGEYGGAFVAPGIVRFDPAFREGAGTVTIATIDGGRLAEVGVAL